MTFLFYFYFINRLQYFEDKKFEESLLAYDSFLLHSKDPGLLVKAKVKVLNSLKNSGLDFVLKSSSLFSEAIPELADAKFKHAWKLGQWNNELDLDQSKGFSQNFYSALNSLVNLSQTSDQESSLNKTLKITEDTKRMTLNEINESCSSVARHALLGVVNLYNLEQISKFASHVKAKTELEFIKEEIRVFDYESQYFSKFDSFELFDDLLNVRAILNIS